MKRLTVPCLATALALLAASPALAAETSPTMTPSTIAPGSSPAIEVTYTVTSAVTVDPDPDRLVWDLGVGFDGVTIPADVTTPAVADTSTGVISCAFPGGVNGSFTNVDLANLTVDTCWLFVDTSSAPTQGWVYFAVTFTDDLTAPATPLQVTARLDAGALAFPSAEGTYGYEAYTWNTDYVDRTVSSYNVGTAAAGTETRHYQALPMPASGDCADIKDADYGWGTGLTGGWTKGWEPWVNATAPEGQRGGWACTRALVNRGGNTWFTQ